MRNQPDTMNSQNHTRATTFPVQNVSLTHHPSSLVTISSQMVLVALLFLISILGNASIIVLIKRFKTLRTRANIFLANKATVDILNIVLNLPGFILVVVLEMNEVARGRRFSAAVFTTQMLFNILKLLSALTLIGDRFLGISLGFRYSVLKSKKAVIVALAVVWFLAIAITAPWSYAIAKIDLGDAPTINYRIAYFNQVGKTASFFVFSIGGSIFVVISLLTYVSFKSQMKVSS